MDTDTDVAEPVTEEVADTQVETQDTPPPVTPVVESGGPGVGEGGNAPAPPDTVSTPPVPPGTEDERFSAIEEKLQKQAETLAKQTTAMRASLLASLGVKDKYRSFAPEVDPFTDEGKRTLEAWVGDNPELCDRSPTTATPTYDVDAKVKNLRAPHLVDPKAWKKRMAGG